MNNSDDYIKALVSEAISLGPKDPLTKFTYGLQSVLRLLFVPLYILFPISTFILGILVTLSFGLLLLPFSLIWGLLFGLLLVTSKLWIKFWILRPILIIPGICLSVISFYFNNLMPSMGERYQKLLKSSLCDSWPYSSILFELSRK